MKKKINISIQSDFVSKVFNNFLENKMKKDFIINLKINSQETININMNSDLIQNYDIVIFLSHIEKTFINYKNFCETNKLNLKVFENEIKFVAKKIIDISKNNKKLIFFLWPLDTDDSYFGPLNFKKKGKNWLINYANLIFSSELSLAENIIILDPNYSLLKSENKINVFDFKTKYLVNNNFNLDYLEHLASVVSTNIIKIYNQNKVKLIIIDLDDTIWGGKAGEKSYNKLEIGPNSIKGQIFQEFQNRLKILKGNGILLAICSKNDLKNVYKVFKQNNYMKLKLSDFSAVKINWEGKNKNIREILSKLNLRSENTLFIDNSKYEREIVKADLKNIQVLDFPNNLLNLNSTINNYPGFDKNYISETDKNRAKFYLQEKRRNKKKENFFNELQWIKSLNIIISIKNVTNFQRAEEMFLRYNQFNTSHKLLNKSEIINLVKKKNTLIYEISMNDKFGDYGIISLLCIKNEKKKFYVTHFLQSCRVFKRNIEQAIISFISNKKIFRKKQGYILINRNKKNLYVQNLFDNSIYLKKNGDSSYSLKKNFSFADIKKSGIKINKN